MSEWDALETPLKPVARGRGRKPLAKAPQPSELQIQAAFRSRLYYAAPKVHVVAIPNGGKRSLWAAQRAKSEGMVAGAPDVICYWPGGLAWIEFKTARGSLSDNQVEFIDRLARCGQKVAVCRSADEALMFLRSCGAPIMEQAA